MTQLRVKIFVLFIHTGIRIQEGKYQQILENLEEEQEPIPIAESAPGQEKEDISELKGFLGEKLEEYEGKMQEKVVKTYFSIYEDTKRKSK